jgi:hypothetical protein
MRTLRIVLALVLVVGAINLQIVQADQPHMKSALSHLRAARAEIERAEHNKGGHRARAADLVNRAIAEVEAGIAYAK